MRKVFQITRNVKRAYAKGTRPFTGAAEMFPAHTFDIPNVQAATLAN